MIEWNPLVNTRISLDGEFSLQEGYVKELQFNSGKKRAWLTNSFVPRVFPSLKLALDNKTPTKTGKTEFEEFIQWFNKDLRYGILPFKIVRLGSKNELGIYRFIPNSVNYDKLTGISLVSFGLEEIGVESIEVPPVIIRMFLVTNYGKRLLTNDGKYIMASGV